MNQKKKSINIIKNKHNKKQNNSKKEDKNLNINDDKELKVIK